MESKLTQPESHQEAVVEQSGGVRPSQDVLDHQAQVAAGTAAEVPEALRPYDWETEEPQGGVTMTGEGNVGKENAQKDTEATQSDTPIIQRPLMGPESDSPEIDTRFDSDHAVTSTPEGNVYSATRKPVDHGSSPSQRTDSSADGLLVDDKPLLSDDSKLEAATSEPESAQKMPEPYLKRAEHEPGINRIQVSDGEVADHEFKEGERVTYTTLGGKTGEYIVVKPTSGDKNPGLILRDPETKNEFAISGNAAEAVRRRQTPEPPRTEPPRTEPPRTEPPRTEPPRTEPPRTEPPRTEPPAEETPVPGGGEPPRPGAPEGNGAGREQGPEAPGVSEAIPGLEDAIQRLAKAKERNRSLVSRFHRKSKNESGLNDKGELEAATENLKQVFSEYVRSVARTSEEPINAAKAEILRLQTEYWDKKDAAEAAGNLDDLELKAERDTIYADYLAAEASLKDIEKSNRILIIQEMGAARLKVDKAQLELVGHTWPGKFRQFWRKHPGWRAGIGAGLTGAAVAAGAFAPPLALGAIAAKRVFGTMSTYYGVEGGAQLATDKLSARAERKAIEKGIENTRNTLNSSAVEEGNQFAQEFTAGRPEDEQKYIEQFVQENYMDILLKPDSLQEVLNSGAQASPEAIVSRLMDRRLSQLKKDARRSRNSKWLAVGAAVLMNAPAVYHWADSRFSPRHSGGVGTGGGASDATLNEAFYNGQAMKQGPGAANNLKFLTNAPGVSKQDLQTNANNLFNQNPMHDPNWMNQIRKLPTVEKQIEAAQRIGASMDAAHPLTQSGITEVINNVNQGVQ